MSELVGTDQYQPLPAPAPEQHLLWYVLRTRSRQEKALSEQLEGRDLVCFLPLLKQARYYGRSKRYVELPLFAGYLFVYGSRDDAFEADRSRFAAQLIEVTNQARFYDDISQLHRAIALQAPLNPYPTLQKGVRVEVRVGPFKGIRGKVADIIRGNRLVLEVAMLGQGAAIEIDPALLDVIDDEG